MSRHIPSISTQNKDGIVYLRHNVDDLLSRASDGEDGSVIFLKHNVDDLESGDEEAELTHLARQFSIKVRSMHSSK
jgi:hypothetical protein